MEAVKRPLTCQLPVMPGLTRRRSLRSSFHWTASWGSAGRGPTRLMSPLTTLISCGSSSIEVLRRNWPTRVTRGSSAILNIGPAASLCAISSGSIDSAPCTIVRSLYTVKGLPLRPTRVWVKSTPRPAVTLMASAASASTGETSSSPSDAATMSKPRLANERHVLVTGSTHITGYRPRGRSVTRRVAMSRMAEESST